MRNPQTALMQSSGGWPNGSTPPGWDLLTALRLGHEELDERATKHGEEIDEIREQVEDLHKLKDTVRRYLLWATTSAASIVAHYWQGPLAEKVGGLLKVLAIALK